MAISFTQGEAGETSNPVKRIRWATQRVSGRRASTKRRSIFNRNAARQRDAEKKRESSGTELDLAKPEQEDLDPDEGNAIGRSIYVNIPLPASARDEDGKIFGSAWED